MAIFDWRAEVSTSGQGEFSMLSSNFGDGYSQDIPNGLNNEKQKWTVTISGYADRVDPPLAFIRTHKGVPFEWQAPRSSGLGWYKCKRYSLSDSGAAYWTLTMEFEQAYMP